MDSEPKLLFVDTFLHGEHDLYLDLVQFPQPVFVREVRVIPLGVKIPHPEIFGGNMLGATNPSKFDLELFVNDLVNPGAATFEFLGLLNYDQGGAVSLRCKNEIPTDGLVIRGWYSAITLAVLGEKADIEVTDQKIADPALVAEEVPVADEPVVVEEPEVPETPPARAVSPTATATTSSTANTADSTPIDDLIPAQPSDLGPITDENDFRLPDDEGLSDDESRTSKPSPPRSPSEPEDEEKPLSPKTPRSPSEERRSPPPREEQDLEQTSRKHSGSRSPRRRSRRRSSSSSSASSASSAHSRSEKVASNSEIQHSESGGMKRASRSESRSPARAVKRPRVGSGRRSREGFSAERSGASGDDRHRRPPSRSSESNEDHPQEVETPHHVPEDELVEDEKSSPVHVVEEEEEERVYLPTPMSPEREPSVEKVVSEKRSVERCGPALPLSAGYQDFEEIVSDDDLPEEMGDDDIDDFRKDEELTGLKSFDPLSVTEFQPLICIADPSLTEGELETRKMLLLRTSEEMRHDRENEDEEDEGFEDKLPEAAKMLSLLVATHPEPESTSNWVTAVEQAIPLLPKAVAQLMYMGRTVGVLDVLLSWAEFGTDFEAAFEQTERNYVQRHLKAGVKLCSAICSCSPAIASRLLMRNVQHRLLNLYEQQHMSTPMKLLVIQALDRTLDLKLGFNLAVRRRRRRRRRSSSRMMSSSSACLKRSGSETDMDMDWDDENAEDDDVICVDDEVADREEGVETSPSLYERLCFLLLNGPAASRSRVLVLRILNKVHFWELIDNLVRDMDALLADHPCFSRRKLCNVLAALSEILRLYRRAPSIMGQPGQQLPAKRQLNIRPPVSDPFRGVFSALQTHSLPEILLVIASLPGPMLRQQRARVCSFLDEFCSSLRGLAFLSANSDCLAALLKILMPKPPKEVVDGEEVEEERRIDFGEAWGVRAQMLGVQIIYYLQALKLIDNLLREHSTVSPCSTPQPPISSADEADEKKEISSIGHAVKLRDVEAFIEPLKSLYSLLFNPCGKWAVAHVLGLENNLDIILQFLSGDVEAPACRGYALGLLACVLQCNDSSDLLSRYCGVDSANSVCAILESVSSAVSREKQVDSVDPTTGNRKSPYTSVGYASQAHYAHVEGVTRDLLQLLEPIRNGQNLDPDFGIPVLCEMVEKRIETLHFDEETPPPFPWALLTSLRVLRGMAVPGDNPMGDPYVVALGDFDETIGFSLLDEPDQLSASENPVEEDELKFDNATIAMFSSGLLVSLKSFLSKLTEFYDQPSASWKFFGGGSESVSMSTSALLSLLDASVSLFHRLTVAAVVALGDDFKDLSLAPVFLKVHSLAVALSEASWDTKESAFKIDRLSRRIQRKCIDALSVHLRPKTRLKTASSEEVKSEGGPGVLPAADDASVVGKSLWTNVLKAVFDHMQSAPHQWLPGMKVLSGLVPLPLPMQLGSEDKLAEEEASQLSRLRKLWCAHLYCLGEEAFHIFKILPRTSSSVLHNILLKVVVQFCDLGTPIAMLVTRQLVQSTVVSCGDEEADRVGVKNAFKFLSKAVQVRQTRRILLELLDGNDGLDEDSDAVGEDSSGKATKKIDDDGEHREGGFLAICSRLLTSHRCEAVADFFSVLVDPRKCAEDELLSRRGMVSVVSLLFDCLGSWKSSDSSSLAAAVIRCVMVLSRTTDYGLYHLVKVWNKRTQSFHNFLRRFATHFDKDNPKDIDVANALVDLVHICSTKDVSMKNRTLFLTDKDVRRLFWSSWKRTDDGDDPHPLTILEDHLATEDESNEDDGGVLEDLRADVSRLVASFEAPNEEDDVYEVGKDWKEPEGPERAPLGAPPCGDLDTSQYFSPVTFNEQRATEDRDLVPIDLIDLMTSCCDCATLGGPDQPPTNPNAAIARELARWMSKPAFGCPVVAAWHKCQNSRRRSHRDVEDTSSRWRHGSGATFREPGLPYRAPHVPIAAHHPRYAFSSYRRGGDEDKPKSRKNYSSSGGGRERSGGASGGAGGGRDNFRSRPPNTSRPPSMHVDDFVALESQGHQPTGPTGYNPMSKKALRDLFKSRTGRSRLGPGFGDVSASYYSSTSGSSGSKSRANPSWPSSGGRKEPRGRRR